MKDYKQFLKQLPSSTVYCALGEFDPPTLAHEMLIKTVKRLSEDRNSSHIIFTSPSKTLDEDKKNQYLSLLFPKVNFQPVNESFLASIKELSSKYKNITVVAGSEQINSLKKSLKESVKYITIPEKDPDSNDAKMRSYASKGLFEDFKKKLPTTIRELDSKRLMNDIRHGLGLESIKQEINLVKDTLREQYFRGEIFNIGELVESSGIQYEIVKRGSNHLLLKCEDGSLISKWITDVNEAVIQPNGTDKIDTNAPENQGNNQVQKPKGKVKGFLTFYNVNDESKNVKESTLNPKDPHGDYKEKSKVLHQLSLDKNVDQKAVQQRKLDLEKEYSKIKEEIESDYCPECMENPCVCGGNHIDEAKKEVCPKCGKNPCECDEERPGIGTETSMSKDPFFKESDLTDSEIDQLVESVTFEDILEMYEEDEIALVYEDNGEEVPICEEEAQIDLMEVLSRAERIRAKMRFRRTKAKRERSTKIALKRYSPVKTINARARRLAVRLMKQRLLRGRNYKDVSIGDKERIDKTIQKRKNIIDRIAAKLVSRVRGVEKKRMSQDGYTKPNTPQVF